MFKTYNINLAGQIFHINEDAFDLLSNYLQSLKNIYKNEEGGDEIIRDIEARISEIVLLENKSDSKKVIEKDLVQKIIQILGSPEQHSDIYTDDEESSKQSTQNNDQYIFSKKLYRDSDNQILAGVCSGLSQYLGIQDAIWLRLLFVISVFAGFGAGIIAYIVLWILLPEAKTASEKLQMKGEAINLDNIEKVVKQSIHNVNQTLENPSLNKTTKSLGNLLKSIFQVIYKLTKAFVLFILLIVVIALVFSLFVAGFSSFAIAPVLSSYIFESTLISYITVIALFILIGLTALFLILLPFQLFSTDKKPLKKPVGITIAVLWIGAFIVTVLGSIEGVRHFSTMKKVTQEEVISGAEFGDTIVIASIGMNNGSSSFDIQLDDWKIGEDGIYNGLVDLNIAQSPDQDFHIFKTLSARGKNLENANNNVKNIEYQYNKSGDTLTFNGFVGDVKDQPKFRAQKVNVTLYIPEGKTIIFRDDESILEKLPRIKNSDSDDYIFNNSAWKLEGGFLTPLSYQPASNPTENGWVDITSGNFTEVEINGFIQTEIIYSTEYKVLVNELSDIKTSLVGNELRIDSKDDKIKTNTLNPSTKIKIYAPSLEKISTNGLIKTEVNGFVQDRLQIDLDGGSTLRLNNNNVRLFDLEVNGLAKINGNSTFENAKIEINGSGIYEGGDIIIQNLNIELNGAAKAEVHATQTLRGELNALSSLEYIDQPNLQVSSKGKGRISKK